MKPEHIIFLAHLESAAFQEGVDKGRWGMCVPPESIAWPHVIIWVSADTQVMAGGRVNLRFDLEGYPLKAPTACPWDLEKGAALDPEKWPRGRPQVEGVFKPGWNQTALYLPCDRKATDGGSHAGWASTIPSLWWKPDFTVVKYLDFVHGCLNRQQYENPQYSAPALVAAAA